MGKAFRCCLFFLVLTGAANFAFAQAIGPQLGPLGPAFQAQGSFMSLPPFFPSGLPEAISLGGIRVQPWLRIGYQRIGLNFNLPAFFHEDNSSASLDLSLRDANVWVGSVGFDVLLSPRLFLFAGGEANVKRNVIVIMSDQPLNYWPVVTFKPFEWTGSQFQWWTVEGGVGYRVCSGTALTAGLRRNQLTLQPCGPRDAAGNPVNHDTTLPGLATFSERAYGDVTVTEWIPYLGLQLTGQFYRASLLWSPFADANVQIPVRYVRDLLVIDDGTTFHTDLDFAFRLRKPGTFLEGTFEYQMPLGGTVGLGLWCKGSWLGIRGSGEMNANWSVLRVFQTRDLFGLQGADEQTATYRRSIVAGGLSALVTF